MENYINITQILTGIITVIISVLGIIAVPWIKSKITKSQWENLTNWAKIFVRAAEVLIHGASGLGNERRKKVMEKLHKLCNKYGYDFEEEDLRAALEDAWSNMTGKANKEDDKSNNVTA